MKCESILSHMEESYWNDLSKVNLDSLLYQNKTWSKNLELDF